jgi:hypothetical protein
MMAGVKFCKKGSASQYENSYCFKKIKAPPPKKNGLTLVTFVKHSVVHDGTLWIDLLI